MPTDGVVRKLPAGGLLKLDPGESVTLLPGVWHAFWGEGADVLIGEVSTVNDDLTDNVFAEPIGRFSNIEEDEEPLHLLVSDYDRWLGLIAIADQAKKSSPACQAAAADVSLAEDMTISVSVRCTPGTAFTTALRNASRSRVVRVRTFSR